MHGYILCALVAATLCSQAQTALPLNVPGSDVSHSTDTKTVTDQDGKVLANTTTVTTRKDIATPITSAITAAPTAYTIKVNIVSPAPVLPSAKVVFKLDPHPKVISVKSHPEPLNVRSFRTLDNVVPTKVYDEVYNLAGHKYHTTSEVIHIAPPPTTVAVPVVPHGAAVHIVHVAAKPKPKPLRIVEIHDRTDGSCSKDRHKLDPDCKFADLGSCGNACCTLDVKLAHGTVHDAYAALATYLQSGGGDGLFSKGPDHDEAGNDSKDNQGAWWPDVAPWRYTTSGMHTTAVHGYRDALRFSIGDGADGRGAVVRLFSISNINGALSDMGQNYKSLKFLADGLGWPTPRRVYGCGLKQP